ncbi:hypothetical protein ACFYTG_32380 [Streptomyces mirabilis]|uniref:hypothetical protein n=1 Tax=Streptomyces mirabilis TaxID=68239 RepID=UPI003692CABF
MPGRRARDRGRDRREPILTGFGDRVVNCGARPVRLVIVSVRMVVVVVVVPGGRRERSVVGVLVMAVGRDLAGGTHVRYGERRAVPGAVEMGDDQHD